MEGAFSLCALVALILLLALCAKRRAVIMEIPSIDSDIVLKLQGALNLHLPKDIIRFVYLFNRRGYYADLWAELWFSYKRNDTATMHEVWTEIVAEGRTDIQHDKERWIAYTTLCNYQLKSTPEETLHGLLKDFNINYRTTYCNEED